MMSSDKSINLNAYSNVECLEHYSTSKELEDRREERKLFYKKHLQFFQRKNFGEKICAVEIGSGSSVLLYLLAENNILSNGIGIELAKNRWQFAEKWKADKNFKQVHNINDNFKNVKLEKGLYDYYICIDNTLTYLYPESSNYPELMLKQAYDALNSDGHLILDFINYVPFIKGNASYKTWQKFSHRDKYSYGLYDRQYLTKENIIQNKKIYLPKNSLIEEIHLELSFVYTIDSISDLLNNNGFIVKEIHSDFDENAYDENVSERLVLLATKN